jgi:putative membrane protein
MFRTFVPVLVCLTFFATTAHAQSQQGMQQRRTPPTAAAGGANAQGQNPGVQIPNDPQKFAEVLHHMNQKEIRLGQLAQKNAQSSEVRQFGQMMVEQHTQADEKLMQLAQQKGWKLGQPKANTPVERAMMQAEKANEEMLKALNGMAFDHKYMTMMVGDHDMDILKTAQAASQFKGTEVGTLATQFLPVLTQHRERAYQIVGTIKPQPESLGVGGAGQGGGEKMEKMKKQ